MESVVFLSGRSCFGERGLVLLRRAGLFSTFAMIYLTIGTFLFDVFYNNTSSLYVDPIEIAIGVHILIPC